MDFNPWLPKLKPAKAGWGFINLLKLVSFFKSRWFQPLAISFDIMFTMN
jgi:hypothetical protein